MKLQQSQVFQEYEPDLQPWQIQLCSMGASVAPKSTVFAKNCLFRLHYQSKHNLYLHQDLTF